LKVLDENQDRWPTVLRGVVFAYRTSRQKSTGYTPFFLLYGRNAKLPIECNEEDISVEADNDVIADDIIDDSAIDEMKKHLQAMNTVRAEVTPLVSENITQAQARQKRDYQARHKAKKQFNVGDKVLLWNLRRADRKGGRMQDPWLGPYTVSAVTAGGSYELINEEGELLKKKQHGVNLKLFNERCSDDSSSVEPSEANNREHDCSPETITDDSESPQISPLSDNTESDVIITSETNLSGSFSFKPTQASWRTYQCKRLTLSNKVRQVKRTGREKLGAPKQCENVAGDGNCFFRTISRELSGTETNHSSLRDAVVSFMCDSSNAPAFQSYVGTLPKTYIQNSSMSENGTWATENEIVATATILQTTIFVYALCGESYKWLKYDPLFDITGVKKSSDCIYLINSNDHFKRVLDVN